MIKDVEILKPKLIYYNGKRGDVKSFKKILVGARIKNVQRRAKILLFELSNGYFFILHLKMTGQLILRAKGEKDATGGHPWPSLMNPTPNKWTHITIFFTDKSILYFNDIRQFGYIKIFKTSELKKQKELNLLGIEPFDKKFTLNILINMLLDRPKTKIKQLLLDQHFISGIGNIYADESLYFANIHPTRLAGKLQTAEIKKLYMGVKSIILKSITMGGTSANTYVTLNGKKGVYKPFLKVYGKEGEPCSKCQGNISRIKLGGRSSHFCPDCQN